MKNDFEEMCKRLRDRKQKDRCSICVCTNEYNCAYEMVKSYVNGDKSRLFKLKADMQRCGFRDIVPNYHSFTALMISAFTILATVFVEEGVGYALIPIVLLAIYLVYIGRSMWKKQYLSDWGEYISIAMEEVDKEIKK